MQYPVRVVKTDYSGLVKYARDKGVEPCDLDKDEQEYRPQGCNLTHVTFQ